MLYSSSCLLLLFISRCVAPFISSLFYPQYLLPHYRDLTSLAIIADGSRESRISPIVSELVGSGEVKQSASCAAHSWDASHQALAQIPAVLWLVPKPPSVKALWAQTYWATITTAPGSLKVGCAISCIFFCIITRLRVRWTGLQQ